MKDCQAEAGYRTHYSPTDSPLGNLFQKLFFWGTAGAALGGTIDGFPGIVDAEHGEHRPDRRRLGRRRDRRRPQCERAVAVRARVGRVRAGSGLRPRPARQLDR